MKECRNMEISCCVLREKSTVVSEVLTASIIMAMSKPPSERKIKT
jgi:hypothetical protein